MKTRRRGKRRKTARRPVATTKRVVRRPKRRAAVGNPVHRRHHRVHNQTKRRSYKRRRNGVITRLLGIRRRRRNPGGMLAKGFALATAAAGLQFALMWVPPLGGPSAFADAGRTAALGWLAGIVMRRTGILSRFADDVQLAGFTLAGGKMLTAFVLPWVTRLSSSIGSQQAMPAPEASKQMSGIALYQPGMQPFKRYMPPGAGMSGIALYQEGRQNFPSYGVAS